MAGGCRIERILPNAVGVDVEKVEHREPSTLSGEELDRLVDAMPDRYRALVLVAAYSSLRWPELVALRVDRLDLVRDVNRVEEKIVESGRLSHGTPKTERIRRAVTLPHTITLELAEHLRAYPPGESGLVFTAEQGGVIRCPAFHRLVWEPALKRANLEGSGSASSDTRARPWHWEPGRTRSWSRSGSATHRRGCSSSTTPGDSIARTGSSRAPWTPRHVCGTRRSSVFERCVGRPSL